MQCTLRGGCLFVPRYLGTLILARCENDCLFNLRARSSLHDAAVFKEVGLSGLEHEEEKE